MNIKQNAIKDTTNEFRYFLESRFVRVNRLCVSVYSNHDNNAKKRLKAKRCYQLKDITKNYDVFINLNFFIIQQLIPI